MVLLDWNKRQLDGWTEDVYPMGDYMAKFEAFGFDTVKVNGNDGEPWPGPARAAADPMPLSWTR